MFGVFEIGVKATTMGNDLQHRKGYAGSFWSGALPTVISTPRSAPFLGQAIGAAMLQPPLGIVLCLTMMGLGMSLPYIIPVSYTHLDVYKRQVGILAAVAQAQHRTVQQSSVNAILLPEGQSIRSNRGIH